MILKLNMIVKFWGFFVLIFMYIFRNRFLFSIRESTTSENRRQNIFPLKPPACVLVNFLNPQMYLEPPISILVKLYSSVSLVSQ